jgi:hypothetical protein
LGPRFYLIAPSFLDTANPTQALLPPKPDFNLTTEILKSGNLILQEVHSLVRPERHKGFFTGLGMRV